MATKETPPVQSVDERRCHIHDRVVDLEIVRIHRDVCVNDEPLTEFEGNYFCLFHLPTKEKDIAKFERIFQARFKAVEEKIAEIRKLPEDEQPKAKREVSYNFRCVWFPSDIYLSNYTFLARVNFFSATFSARAFFNSATFSADVFFNSATFSDETSFDSAIFSAAANFPSARFSAAASFSSARFSADAYFRESNFLARAYFNSATFSANADFSSTIFSARAYFSSATFSANADFSSAEFMKTSQVFFSQTRFCKRVAFNYSVFAGYVAFEGKKDNFVFLDKKRILEVKKELSAKSEILQKGFAERGIDSFILDRFVKNPKSFLNLQNARLERPERISFHRVRLCPSWFVNIDSREMVFRDVSWDNLDRQFRNPNISAEIESLKDRDISEPSGLLEIACRQLGVNAEENNRYEDASKFRYMAMETKRLEYAWHGRLWTLSWWYRLSSGYGENWRRAFFVLLGVLVLFGLLYAAPFARFDYGERKTEPIEGVGNRLCEDYARIPGNYSGMNLCDGAAHSLSVASFQRPEPKPSDFLTRLLVSLESIFAPLQAALLALAIRRKFMR